MFVRRGRSRRRCVPGPAECSGRGQKGSLGDVVAKGASVRENGDKGNGACPRAERFLQLGLAAKPTRADRLPLTGMLVTRVRVLTARHRLTPARRRLDELKHEIAAGGHRSCFSGG